MGVGKAGRKGGKRCSTWGKDINLQSGIFNLKINKQIV
ncbi:MAG: hypothetical protein RL596_2260 [Bacteroidota bacterium]